jgi:hypothetical protein
MASLSWEEGKSVMKSIEILFQGAWGTGRGCNGPYGKCQGVLARAQVSQD